MITRLLVLLFAAGLYPADSAAIDPAYLIYPLEQASIKIDSGVRSKQRIDLDIKQHCFAKRCPIKESPSTAVGWTCETRSVRPASSPAPCGSIPRFARPSKF